MKIMTNRFLFRALSLCVCALWLALETPAQKVAPYFPPAGTWAKKSAKELGMEESVLAAAIQFAQATETKRPLGSVDISAKPNN